MARWDSNTTSAVGGRVRAFYGNFGMFIRALAYIFANGPTACARQRKTRAQRELHRKGLEGVYDLPYSTPSCMKSFSATVAVEKGVKTMDLAKRLIDYGFHPIRRRFR